MMPQEYTIRKAEITDLAAVMRIERHSFEEGIAEDQAVFAERLTFASDCSYVLVQSEYQSVCGYFTSEIWEAAKIDPAFFALGHSVRERHRPAGTALYISSFALLPEIRGKRIALSQHTADSFHSAAPSTDGVIRLGRAADSRLTVGVAEMFFAASIERIIAVFPQLQRALLLVHENWHKAVHIYEAQGFARMQTLERFTWFGDHRAFVYEKAIKR